MRLVLALIVAAGVCAPAASAAPWPDCYVSSYGQTWCDDGQQTWQINPETGGYLPSYCGQPYVSSQRCTP